MIKHEEDKPLIVDGVRIPLHPWEMKGLSRARFMDWAYIQEKSGMRLVTETLVDAYPDDVDSWVVAYFIYTDWRTGEDIWSYDPGETEVGGQLDGLLVVDRRLVATD